MIADGINCNEEDEDVVIAGSDLHRALCEMGYLDYEIVPAVRTEFPESCEKESSNESLPFYQTARKWILRLYHEITQESNIAEMQLKTIMQVQHLLDDHATVVQHFLKQQQPTNSKTATLIGSTLIGIVGIFLATRKNTLPSLFALPIISTIIVRHKYTRWRATRDLRNLVSLQNEIYYLCKRGLKILRRRYGIKIQPNKVGAKFSELEAERLQCLQPITETMIKGMGHILRTYHKTIRVILNVLPESHRIKAELSTTRFENETFIECGEISYQSLKRMHYTYILIQSEMMQLLATAYSCDTWSEHSGICETKLAHIIHKLLASLTIQKSEISEAIDSFHKFRTRTIRHKYRGIPESKWQDLYVHLDLTSHKIQSAYEQLTSVLRRIDEETEEPEMLEELQQKIDDACRQIDNARNFAEFGRLLIYKMDRSTRQDQQKSPGNAFLRTLSKPEFLVDQNSSPEILDEVFEEYIKGEYLKEYLQDDTDDFSSENKKIDKLLSRNFMSELKEVLVDKQKSMSEREAEALQRMKKTKTSLLEKRENADDFSSDSEDEQTENRKNKAESRQRKDSLEITEIHLSNFNRDQNPLECRKASGFEIKNTKDANNFPSDLSDEKSMFNRESEFEQMEDSLRMTKSGLFKFNRDQSDNQELERSIPPPPPPPPQLDTIIGFDSDRKIISASSVFPSMDLKDESQGESIESERLQNYSEALHSSNLSVLENDTREQHFSIPLTSFHPFSRPFMSVAEETFIGSGENSEEEVVDEEDGVNEKI